MISTRGTLTGTHSFRYELLFVSGNRDVRYATIVFTPHVTRSEMADLLRKLADDLDGQHDADTKRLGGGS